jgi:sugar/nucleoside kinase (ribokinase family)
MNSDHTLKQRVISIGDLVVDILLSIPRLPVQAGQHQPAHQVNLEPGGGGNFLIAGARLGLEMIALGTAGDDPLGDAMLRLLGQEGIQVSEVIRQPGTTTTTVVVLVDQAGQNVFLGGYGQGPEISLPDGWLATLAEMRDAQAALELMAQARSRGIPVFFDPGPDMSQATPGQIQAVLSHSAILLLTEEEIPFITGGKPGLDAARRLLDDGLEAICVKRGAQGCILFSPGETIEHPGFPVLPRDPTGAGDSFAAAFIYAYLRGWQPAEIIAFANAMGAAKVQKLGSGRQVPTAAEVRSILAADGSSLDF